MSSKRASKKDQLLSILWADGNLSRELLAARLESTGGSVGVMLSRLKKEGYVDNHRGLWGLTPFARFSSRVQRRLVDYDYSPLARHDDPGKRYELRLKEQVSVSQVQRVLRVLTELIEKRGFEETERQLSDITHRINSVHEDEVLPQAL